MHRHPYYRRRTRTCPRARPVPHFISSEEPFGLSVVGTASYQSYGYLGGVGVRLINPNPVIE